MGFRDWFTRNSDVHSLTVSNWLENIFDRLLEISEDRLKSGESSPSRLAIFSTVYSTKGAHALLSIQPGITPCIGNVLLELRMLFDSAWYIYLRSELSSEAEAKKLSNLYALVQMSEDKIWDSIFRDNPKIQQIFGPARFGLTPELLGETNKAYLGRELSDQQKARYEALRIFYEKRGELCEDPLLRSTIFILRFQRLLERAGLEFQAEVLGEQIHEIYGLSLESNENKLLTRFDLSACTVIEFPDSFYQS